MKLRNKATGEIKEAEARDDGIYLYSVETGQWFKYDLPLLAEYWEYYIEPKKPLIVEKEFRELIRKCFNLSLSDKVNVHHYKGYSMFYFNDGLDVSITWKLAIVTHIKNGEHTLTELCGESEE